LRKIRKLSFFGILGVVIAALFLISISFTQAQVQTQGKPDSPPGLDKKDPKEPEEEATWAVQIPTQTEATNQGLMFYGMNDGYYEDNGVNIEVSVEKNSMAGPWKKYFNFTYAFDFILTNDNLGTSSPPTDQVGFQKVGGLYDDEYPNPGELTDLFPGGDIIGFLNNLHPYSDGTPENGYESIWFEVHIFDQDIELMEPGEIYVFGSDRVASDPGDYLSIWARYRGGLEGCSPDPLYHDAFLYRNINVERAADNGFTPNIEIKRLDEYTWRFWVRPTGFLKVNERYCTIVKRKPKTIYTMEAKANFDFYIDFIKNPSTGGTE